MSRRVVLALMSLLALLGACGLSEDGSPQAIAPENLPPDLLDPNPGTSTTLPESPGTSSVSVYFLEQVGGQDRLAEVRREVANPSDPGDRLDALFSQPTEAGLTTSIPADTRLRAVPVLDADAGELTVDLSSEFLSIEGPELAKAFAQIVWTVSELDEVDQVRFLVDGEEIRAQDADGVEQEGAVTRGDYNALAPLP